MAAKSSPWPVVALICAMLLWGASFPAFKFTLDHFNGWFVVWVRMVIAGGVAAAVLPFLRKPRWRTGDLKWLAVMAFCEPCLYFYFEKQALLYTSAAQAGVIVALLPLLVAMAAAVFLRERMTRRLGIGMGLAFVGAVVVSLAGSATSHAPNPLLGNFLELLAMASATGYIIALKKLGERWSPWHIVAIQHGVGILFFLPFTVLTGGFAPLAAPGAVLPMAWAALGFLGLAVSMGAFLCYTLALQRIPANRASVYTNLIPVFAVALSLTFLGEQLNVVQLSACLLIVAGLVLSQSKPAPQPVRAATAT